MGEVRWQSAVDFLVLTAAVYLLLKWSREARALRFALGILALRVGALLARQLDLLITRWVLDAATFIALLALLVVFQPEIRRALMRLDVSERVRDRDRTPIAAIAAAAWSLAQVRCGALIVLVRSDNVSELVTTGVVLEGRVSTGILQAIFQKGSPVHDGAVVIEGGLIRRAGAVLPLTQQPHVPTEYGTRHRAGLGLTERSDAVVVVVSEERGQVTVMWEGLSRTMQSLEDLQATLKSRTARVPARQPRGLPLFRPRSLRLAAAALALASLVWSLTFLFPGGSIRERTVPIEFTKVPAGMTVSSQSADTVRVWLRGSDFLFDSVNLNDLVARCDLAHGREGTNTVVLDAEAFAVPFGLEIEAIDPREVSVHLERGTSARTSEAIAPRIAGDVADEAER